MLIRKIGSAVLFCFLAALCSATALDSLILVDSFSTKADRLYADPLGSFYLVEKNRSIEKFSASGKFLFRYSNNRLGDIGWMDTNDPFRLQLYFPEFRKLVLLDNDLSSLESYDLMALGLYDHPGVGLSYDNNFWLFDNNTGQIKKINKRGELLLESDNIFYNVKQSPSPSRVVETKKYVLLMDEHQGIFVFDQFGKYLKNLEGNIPEHFQIWKNRVVYFSNGALHFLGLDNGQKAEVELPGAEQIVHAQFSGDQLFTLQAGKVFIYQIPK